MIILLVDDEEKIVNFVKKGLELAKYTVETASDGEEALNKALINNYDLIILDIMLPKINGFDVCKKLREEKIDSPIIILTAMDSVEDKIKGLDYGADDYLAKPFALKELIARIRALLRREKTVKSLKLKIDNLVLDPAKHEVTRGDKEIKLSNKEYRLLDYMMRRPGQICTRTMIGEHVWGYNFIKESNIIDVHISLLRKKVDKGFRNKLIYTVRDVGYKIQEKNNKKH